MRKLASCLRVAVLGRIGLLVFAGLTTCVVLPSCTTYRDHLQRGQRLYQENEFDGALAVWRTLEPDMDSLTWEEQARYSYLRGMTDYRLGFKSDARHWLAIAKAINGEHPGGLEGDWPQRTDAALDELSRDVFGLAEGSTDSQAIEHPVDPDEDLGRSSRESETTPATKKPGPVPCRSEADCAGEEVCVSSRCMSN